MNAAQTTWIAAGCSLLGMAFITSLAIDKSFAKLIVSDDSYIASFAATVPVTAFVAMGVATGWWFQSTRISWIATFLPLLCFSALLWIADLAHDFGEGDQLVGYLGIGTLLGGVCGSLAFTVQNPYSRLLIAIVPHVVFVAGYLTALNAMSHS
ncbi:hypothetical protein [Allorhodopirellula solitaria]|uniref:hypothetical protein n=1 Tax=Allorhodopirellula solitaria TaxID=2527987 RepID=UPI0011B6FD95|nr:hypothetical protein [Allorhodopirellula solitaria]